MMAGSNIELLQRVSGATDAGILASGGVDSLDDLRALAAVDGVDQVRGRGLLLGVGLEGGFPPAAELAAALATCGFITNAPRPDTIRLAPPFILPDDDARAFTTTLSEVLARALSEKAGS